MPKTKEFNNLLNDLEKESGFYSIAASIEELPIFKQVISHGVSIVPSILLKLRKGDGNITLHLALSKITGEHPSVANAGKVKEINRWWLDWGHRQGYLIKISLKFIPKE
jgi:hypothetical protein